MANEVENYPDFTTTPYGGTNLLDITEDLGGGNWKSTKSDISTFKSQLGIVGTANYLAKYNAANLALEASIINQDTTNNNFIGIDTPAPLAQIHVTFNNNISHDKLFLNGSSGRALFNISGLYQILLSPHNSVYTGVGSGVTYPNVDIKIVGGSTTDHVLVADSGSFTGWRFANDADGTFINITNLLDETKIFAGPTQRLVLGSNQGISNDQNFFAMDGPNASMYNNGIVDANTTLYIKGVDNGVTNYSLRAYQNSGTPVLAVRNDGVLLHNNANANVKANFSGPSGQPSTNTDGVLSIQAFTDTTSTIRFGIIISGGGWMQAGAYNSSSGQHLRIQPIGGRTVFGIETQVNNAAFEIDADTSGASVYGVLLTSGQRTAYFTNHTVPSITTTDNYSVRYSISGGAATITNHFGLEISNAAVSVNSIGLRVNATGGTTNNYSILVPSGGGRMGLGTVTPNASALLDIVSTTQGFLPPRMTTAQKNAISSPSAGLVVYDTDLAKLCVYTTSWETITSI